jgi:hypothetical protein
MKMILRLVGCGLRQADAVAILAVLAVLATSLPSWATETNAVVKATDRADGIAKPVEGIGLGNGRVALEVVGVSGTAGPPIVVSQAAPTKTPICYIVNATLTPVSWGTAVPRFNMEISVPVGFVGHVYLGAPAASATQGPEWFSPTHALLHATDGIGQEKFFVHDDATPVACRICATEK